MKNILTLPSCTLAVILLVAALLAGCKPSAEQQARIEEQRREHALTSFMDGDVLPKVDTTTQEVLKRGGKFFIAPKEYFAQGNMHGFYWPSKTPMYRGGGEYPEREMVRSGKAGAVEIAFQIEASSSTGETYGVIEQANSNGESTKRSTLRDGLDRVERADKFKSPLYVATKLVTPSGLPPALSCDEGPGHAGTSGFVWKPGFRIYVRFDSAHCKDWPEIYSEIIRVLNLVKAA